MVIRHHFLWRFSLFLICTVFCDGFASSFLENDYRKKMITGKKKRCLESLFFVLFFDVVAFHAYFVIFWCYGWESALIELLLSLVYEDTQWWKILLKVNLAIKISNHFFYHLGIISGNSSVILTYLGWERDTITTGLSFCSHWEKLSDTFFFINKCDFLLIG